MLTGSWNPENVLFLSCDILGFFTLLIVFPYLLENHLKKKQLEKFKAWKVTLVNVL